MKKSLIYRYAMMECLARISKENDRIKKNPDNCRIATALMKKYEAERDEIEKLLVQEEKLEKKETAAE